LGGASSPKVAELQAILRKANPAYQGQGKFHEENGEIVAAELPNCNLSDLSPLKGLSLFGMDISGNPVREIRHLKGMPLRNLFMENTLVEDLSPLKGAPIVELRLNGSPLQSLKGLEGMPVENLYMLGTKVTDVSALAGSKLRQLWLNETPVSNLAPLAGAPIVSLTLHRTKVSDLSFIRNLPVIQRLHIAETPVTDLTPLKGVPLTRLVFTPAKIEKGLEVARQLFGLREIGTRFDDQSRDLMPPDQFWSRFDNGEFR
jgi:Leucine-rich repeat (LRR) protein